MMSHVPISAPEPYEPCRMLLGGREYPAIRLGKLVGMLDSNSDSVPEQIVMMRDGSVKSLAGVSRGPV